MNLQERLKNQPIETQAKYANKYLVEAFNQSLFLTSKHLCGYREVNINTHGDMIYCLESKTNRKLIIMPRGTFKSSVSSVAYPIWLLNNNPNLRILLDSELYTNSKNFLREIKTHLTRPKIEGLYGVYRNDSCWNESEILINQRTETKKEASITASGIGAEKTGQHYDVIIMDDLNSPSNSGTQEGLEKVIQHYRYNISILEPNGIMVVVATRYQERDIPGFILRNEVEDAV